MVQNINDYTSLPTTPYREFVDKIQDHIKYINGLELKDEDRYKVLRGALLGWLEIKFD